MKNLLEHKPFMEAYRKMERVRLNPRRHTAANGLAHSEAVAERAVALGKLNGFDDDTLTLLENLGRAHDIGKITGTARPERSLEVLKDCGIDDVAFLALVKWHDTSLPWMRSTNRGQPPSEKAWRRIASETDLNLLSIFMVADREDAPAGWRDNPPTTWLHAEARKRGLVGELKLDLPGIPSSFKVGVTAIREVREKVDLLLQKKDMATPSLLCGDMHFDETKLDSALRLLRDNWIQLHKDQLLECGYSDAVIKVQECEYLERTMLYIARVDRSADTGKLAWVSLEVAEELEDPRMGVILRADAARATVS